MRAGSIRECIVGVDSSGRISDPIYSQTRAGSPFFPPVRRILHLPYWGCIVTPNVSTGSAGLFHGTGWVVLLRGLMAVAFGLLAFAWPGVTIPRLVMLFGFYAIAHGVLSAAAAVGNRGKHGSLLLAIEAIVGIWAGVSTLRTSAGTPMAFVLLVWLWAIGTGILLTRIWIRMERQDPLSGEGL